VKRITFAWDQAKNRANQKKHGVSFEEAQTVFYDPNAIEFYDDEHSEWEDRFLMLGVSARLRVVLVCHCYRKTEAVIRIISVRKATARERQFYRG